MHACLFKKTDAELSALVEHVKIMSCICAKALRLVRADKASSRRPRLLPSELLAVEEDEKVSEDTPAKALKVGNELRAKLREWVDKAERGILMGKLDNDTKRNVAGFAGRYGVHAVKAHRYHGADSRLTCDGFVATLKAYQGSPEDAALEDDISACTLEEFLLDAKGVLPQLEASVGSIVDILSKVPLMGRTLTIQPPCDGAEMNPWLVEVVGMPTMIKVMTTYDLLHTPPEVLNMRADRTASLIPPVPVPVRRTELMRQSSPTGLRREQSTADLMPQSSPTGLRREQSTADLMPPPSTERPPALLSRETDPEFFALFNGHDNPFQSDNDSEDDRAFVASHAIAELEERMLQRQGSSAVIARIDEDSWGGVEEFSGYLTDNEYDDDDDEDSILKRKPTRRDPPPETINHLLLLPGSVGGGARPGWMHQAATYLLVRNESLFFFDAWMGTMAATVTYLLEQPDVSAGWVQAELARVQGAFSAVYRNDNAGKFHSEYCGAMLSADDYRQALVTQCESFPAGLRCPHLTKPIFAMWVVTQVNGVRFTADAVRARQLAFLVEFFHRAGVRLAWECAAKGSTQDWFAAHSLGDVKDPMSYGPTLAKARKAYLQATQAALRGATPEEAIKEPQLDMQAVESARHFQFTVASIARVFSNLASLSGIKEYSHAVCPRRLARILQVAAVGDNAKRSAEPLFAAPMPEEEFQRVGTRRAMGLFRAAGLAWADAAFSCEYKEMLRLLHQDPAKTVPAGHAERFKQKWGVDVAAKLDLRACGLSSVACMSPFCPHFLAPMDSATHKKKGVICGNLGLHLQPLQLFPGLHKSVQRLIDEGRAEDSDASDSAACEVLHGLDLLRRPPSGDKIYQEYAASLAHLRKKRNLTPSKLAELQRIVVENFERRTGLAREEYAARLKERAEEALVHRGVSGTPLAKSWVSGRIHTISMQRNEWDYADFEAAVLASPLVRSAETGRFSVVARPHSAVS